MTLLWKEWKKNLDNYYDLLADICMIHLTFQIGMGSFEEIY